MQKEQTKEIINETKNVTVKLTDIFGGVEISKGSFNTIRCPLGPRRFPCRGKWEGPAALLKALVENRSLKSSAVTFWDGVTGALLHPPLIASGFLRCFKRPCRKLALGMNWNRVPKCPTKRSVWSRPLQIYSNACPQKMFSGICWRKPHFPM